MHQSVGKHQARRRHPGDGGDLAHVLRHGDVLAAQDVALAGAAALQRRQVTPHHVSDVDDVQPAVGDERDLAACHLHDDGIEPVQVARPEHFARVDDDGIQTAPHRLLYFQFRQVLGAGVRPALRLVVPGVLLVHQLHAARPVRHAQGGHRTGVHHPAHVVLQRRLHHAGSPGDGHRHPVLEFFGRAQLGGNMEDHVHPLHGFAQRIRLGDIADEVLDGKILEL